MATKKKPAKPVKKKLGKKKSTAAKATASPEVQPLPPLTVKTREQIDREAARAARRLNRDIGRIPDATQLPAAVAASVISIDDARRKRTDLDEAFKKEIKKREPITLEMDETTSYKLLHLFDVRQRNLERVRQPLLDAAKVAIEAEIEVLKQKKIKEIGELLEVALSSDSGYVEAENAHTAAVNAAVDTFEAVIPTEYAVLSLGPESRTAHAVIDVAGQRGNRLILRELKG
jgi:hypothetical protein